MGKVTADTRSYHIIIASGVSHAARLGNKKEINGGIIS